MRLLSRRFAELKYLILFKNNLDLKSSGTHCEDPAKIELEEKRLENKGKQSYLYGWSACEIL
jgi:hypothetical protein